MNVISLSSLLCLCLAGAPALAASDPTATPASPPAEPDATADQPGDAAGGERSLGVYVLGRRSIALLLTVERQLVTTGVSLGLVRSTRDKLGVQIGLRGIYVPDPPPNFTITFDPDVDHGYGGVVDLKLLRSPNAPVAAYLASSIGFVSGRRAPEQGGTIATSAIAELGLGLQLQKQLRSGQRLFVAADLGGLPVASVVYTGVNLGVMLPIR